MPCASCEERARLLKEARDVFFRGDMVEVERLLKEVFGTIKVDAAKLSAVIFKTKEDLQKIAAADPNIFQEHLGGSGVISNEEMSEPSNPPSWPEPPQWKAPQAMGRALRSRNKS